MSKQNAETRHRNAVPFRQTPVHPCRGVMHSDTPACRCWDVLLNASVCVASVMFISYCCLWIQSSHSPGWKRQQSDQKQPVKLFFTTKNTKHADPTALYTLDAATAGVAGASSLSAPMKAVPLGTDMMTELSGVMEELHLGGGFQYPGAVLPTDDV